MWNIDISELSMVFYECEFDMIMHVLDTLPDIIKDGNFSNADELIDSITATKEKIIKDSFFDPEYRQVYIVLSGDEWTHIIQGLIFCTAGSAVLKRDESIISFKDIIAKDTTKIWKD